MKVCAIENCGKPCLARGWCTGHYSNWRRHGKPVVSRPTVAERALAKIQRNAAPSPHRPDLGPCWHWTGRTNQDGYGELRGRRSDGLAHRIVFEHMVGPVPVGLELDHLCRVRYCVNPQHLEPVTPKENWRRGTSVTAQNAAKTHCHRGHPFDSENTYVWRNSRICRACAREAKQRRQERKREASS
jgi:hypothetical protein